MKQTNNSYMLLGAGIIILGLIVLSELLNIVHGSAIYEILWPATVFLTGLCMVSTTSTRNFGFVIMWIGFLLLLRQLHVFDSDTGKTALVFVLTLTGLGVMTQLGDKITPTTKD